MNVKLGYLGGNPGVDDATRQYLAAIGRKGGQKSRRKLTKAQARAMVRARTAKRAALRPNDQRSPTRPDRGWERKGGGDVH